MMLGDLPEWDQDFRPWQKDFPHRLMVICITQTELDACTSYANRQIGSANWNIWRLASDADIFGFKRELDALEFKLAFGDQLTWG